MHKKYNDIEEWKDEVRGSSHVRKDEAVAFHEDNEGVVSAFVEGLSVFLGAYSTKGREQFKEYHGWFHP